MLFESSWWKLWVSKSTVFLFIVYVNILFTTPQIGHVLFTSSPSRHWQMTPINVSETVSRWGSGVCHSSSKVILQTQPGHFDNPPMCGQLGDIIKTPMFYLLGTALGTCANSPHQFTFTLSHFGNHLAFHMTICTFTTPFFITNQLFKSHWTGQVRFEGMSCVV